MLETQNLPTFILSGILLNITPGQDTIFIVSRSVAQGRRAGILSALGILSGAVLQLLVVAFGLASLIQAWPLALLVIQWFGAAFLLFLGVSALRSKSGAFSMDATAVNVAGDWRHWRDGLLTDLTNPKVMLFFLAFLPHFVVPTNNLGPLPFLFLGLLFLTTGTIWCMALAWFSAEASRFLREDVRVSGLLNKACGVIFIALALTILCDSI